jgi:hypothetical protein
VPGTAGGGAEAAMDRIVIAVAIGMALVFVIGLVLGVIWMISR